MGYEPEAKAYHLTFEDMPGLEVTASSPSTGDLLDMQELSESLDDSASARKLFRLFARYLTGWNVTRGGKPVPADYDGLLSQDTGLINAIAEGWMDAVIGVDPTSPAASASGGTSPEGSLALGSASRSLPG